jgi:hypothetical protein
LRAYTVAAAAVTLRMPVKWIDNVLSHHTVPGVARSRQGVSRRLTPQAILSLEIAIRLSNALSISVARSLELATRLVREHGELSAGKGLTLALDIEVIQAELAERLANAVEIAPLPRRGRPSKS